MKEKTINELIIEYFEAHPDEEVEHGDVVDYVNLTYPKARDPWRAIRKLYQEGWLIKVKKGVYKRSPGYTGPNLLDPFSADVKEKIFKRDNYKCVVCGNGPHNGYELHADHVKPQHLGGLSTFENGQTLCSEHNLMKKRYGTTDFLSKYCNTMIERAIQYDDKETEKMFSEILAIIKKYKGM